MKLRLLELLRWSTAVATLAVVVACASAPTPREERGRGPWANPAPRPEAPAEVALEEAEPEGLFSTLRVLRAGDGLAVEAAERGVLRQVEVAARPRLVLQAPMDQASVGLTRLQLRQGALPRPGTVRAADFVGAQRYGYAAPAEGAAAVVVDLAPSPLRPGWELLRIGLRARDAPVSPVRLFVVVDATERASSAALALWRAALGSLAEGREARAVTWIVLSDRARVVEAELADAARLVPEVPSGHVDVSAGLERALELMASVAEGVRPRLWLAANAVAAGDEGESQSLIEAAAARGATTSLLGAGRSPFLDDARLGALARAGGGTYVFLADALDQAAATARLRAQLRPALEEARLQVVLDASAVRRYRLLDDHGGAAPRGLPSLGAGEEVTLLLEVQRPAGAAEGEVDLGALELRARGASLSLRLAGRAHGSLRAAPASLRRAAAAAQLAAWAARARGATPPEAAELLEALGADPDAAALRDVALRLRGAR